MVLKCDMTIKGVPGEKVIAITNLNVHFIPALFGLINYAVYANEAALAANDPLHNDFMDVTEIDAALSAASLGAALAALKAGRFPTGVEA